MATNLDQGFNNPVKSVYIIIPYDQAVRKLFICEQFNFICFKRITRCIIKRIKHRAQNYILFCLLYSSLCVKFLSCIQKNYQKSNRRSCLLTSEWAKSLES